MAKSELDAAKLAREMESATPQQILRMALNEFEQPAISFSGAEDVVLIDMVSKLGKNFSVFSLDTGRLHTETYQFIEQVRDHYAIEIEILFPDSSAVENLVKHKGLYSFLKDGHQECCAIRKVAPLRRKLSRVAAWVTGQRKDQSNTRTEVPVIQHDLAFSTPENSLTKFNPLANWSSAEVWQYIRKNQVPYNPLHARGFISIGCDPCTRAVLPSQHEREGRWWWENPADKECGLHSDNVKKVANG